MVAFICSLLLLFFVQSVTGNIEEPKCFSRFDYDEKILMKVLRFEDQLSRKEKIVAFTVTNPAGGSSSTPLTFATVVTNEGDGFDASAGRFMCTVSGLYYFTLNIIKKRADSGVDHAGCYISLNGNGKVRAHIDPQDGATGADYGSYGVTNSVYLRLKVGDVITSQGCNTDGAARMNSHTSFSGYLVRADV